MVNHHLVITLYKDAIALFCAASIAIPSQAPLKDANPLKSQPAAIVLKCGDINERNTHMCIKAKMWLYLRKGINYLEASGKDIPLGHRHPGGKAYGPLALTPIAVKDVQRCYPPLARYRFEDVISKRSLYERFAFLYADLLLRHYIKIDYQQMPKEKVFGILQKAWFLGPTLYKKGHPVIASRELQALRYIIKTS